MSTTHQEPLLVTILAAPAKQPAVKNDLIEGLVKTLKERGVEPHPAASVLAIDLVLEGLVEQHPGRPLSVQIIGHAISGQLYLGATWMSLQEIRDKAKKYPFFLLDTDPEALGLLAKYAGDLVELTLVGCNVGSASSYGYAINGRTLTYTLAELLQCPVRGADDQVAPDEFDDRGMYSPGTIHRKPTGWKWVEDGPPQWLPGAPGVTALADSAARELQLVAVTNTQLPVHNRRWPRNLPAPITVKARRIRDGNYEPRFALPEVTVKFHDGSGLQSAELLDGGRYMRIGLEHYTIDRNDEISKQLTKVLWARDPEQAV